MIILERITISDNTGDMSADEIEICLNEDERENQFIIVSRFVGGGLVNGFEYRIDNVLGSSLNHAAETKVINIFCQRAREDIKNYLWQTFLDELDENREE